jgi:hypothetical protein
MSEEDINSGSEETATSSTPVNVDKNNTSNVREDDKPQKTASVPYSRFKEVNDELQRIRKSEPKGTPIQDGSGDLVLELISKVPDRLRGEMSNIAKYATTHSMPVDDVVTLWDAKNKVSPDAADNKSAADAEAKNSRTGGTANPAARAEASLVSKNLSDISIASLNQNEEALRTDSTALRAEIERQMASGQRF